MREKVPKGQPSNVFSLNGVKGEGAPGETATYTRKCV